MHHTRNLHPANPVQFVTGVESTILRVQVWQRQHLHTLGWDFDKFRSREVIPDQELRLHARVPVKGVAELVECYLHVMFRTDHIFEDERHSALWESSAIGVAHLVRSGTQVAKSVPEFAKLPSQLRIKLGENSLGAFFKLCDRLKWMEGRTTTRVDRHFPIEIPRQQRLDVQILSMLFKQFRCQRNHFKRDAPMELVTILWTVVIPMIFKPDQVAVTLEPCIFCHRPAYAQEFKEELIELRC